MKPKLKKINRGVVLTILVAIVFIIYTAASNSAFKKREADEIKELIISYTNQLAQISVYSDEDGDQLTCDWVKQSSQQARRLIQEYWGDSEYLENYNSSMFSYTYYYLKSDVLRDIEYSGGCFTPTDYITSITSTVSITSIHKNGANGATVKFNITYKVCGEGQPAIYTLTGLNSVYSKLSKDTPSTYSTDYGATAELYKEDGQWKIVGIDWYGLSGSGAYEYY